MKELERTRILFIAGFGPIVRDTDASCELYAKAVGIHFKEEVGGYLHTAALQGAKHFALWPLSQALDTAIEAWMRSTKDTFPFHAFDTPSIQARQWLSQHSDLGPFVRAPDNSRADRMIARAHE